MDEHREPGSPRISVVTPTLRRPDEVACLLENLSKQEHLPFEVILVDGAPADERNTENVVRAVEASLPFRVRYISQGGGTAIQRNVGIDQAGGDFIAFLDDDIRLEPSFFSSALRVFDQDEGMRVGGVVGYRTNEYFKGEEVLRWRWYRRLRLLTTYDPGRYDFACGYPINANMQPPFSGVRKVDFMTSSCAVWRRKVFDSGLRFDTFFSDYGVLEDAHLSLSAGRRNWELLQCGDARCVHLASANGRTARRRVGYKCVVNYYYVFQDVVRPLTLRHKFRFWRFQAFELFRIAISGIRRRRIADFEEFLGRLEGFRSVARGIPLAR
jgi:glycosyltransferase involved in cell wall biosynthesis